MCSEFIDIEENLREIRYRMNEAAAKYRSGDDVIRLMAVTKTVAPEKVNHAVKLGVDLLGENRVQEYLSKKDSYDSSAEVHIIGHLQTNKVKYIIGNVSMIQSVDSIRLAEEINRLAAKNGRIMDILCEVNIGGEESKDGIAPEMLDELLQRAAELEKIRVRGLMTIPPPTGSDIFLAHMQELFLSVREKNLNGVSMDILSMGMTHDYAEAIKYGSNLVRIGTGLFGARHYK